MGLNHKPKIGCFLKIFEIQHLCCFITQPLKKLQQWSLYEGIDNILPFVLITKRPLSNIWLQSCKQNSFEVFFEKIEVLNFFENTQNCFAYIATTKYRSENVLYKKQTAGYSLSPNIKTIALVFLRAE